jgi:Transglutaminase-like superfamily
VIRRLTPRWRIRATLAALALPPLVHVIPLDRLAHWIAHRRTRRLDDAVDDAALAEWVDRVLNRLSPPWHHTCLKRAVVLHYLIRRAGRTTELRIGVRRNEHGALVAHAWLARDDVPYLEPGGIARVGSYQLLTAFPPVDEHDR